MTTTIEGYTPARLAQEVGVGVTTIKTWSKELGLSPVKNSSGRNFFPDGAVEVFQTIKDLREQNKGLETIRRIVGAKSNLLAVADSDGGEEVLPAAENYSPVSVDLIKQEIRATLKENTELAERYAKATYTIGQLEERLKFQEEKLRLLPSSTELTQLKDEVEKLKQENQQLRSQPWWKKWLGQ